MFKSDENEVKSNCFTLSKDYISNDTSENNKTVSVKKPNFFESRSSYVSYKANDDVSSPTYDSQESFKYGKTTKEDISKNSDISNKKGLESLEEAHFAFVSYMQQSRKLSTKELDYIQQDYYNTVTTIEEIDL